MAKVSLARKKELNEPDELINVSNQAAEFVRENKEKVIGVIAAIVLIVVGITGYQFYSSYYEKTAFVTFAKDIKWYQEDGENVTPKSLEEVKERSEIFFKKYSGSVAGTLAKAKYAGIFYTEGDYNSAIELYKKLLKELNGDSALKTMALSGLAYSYEAVKKFDDAIKTFELITEEKTSVKKADALFHLGILYELQGKKEKSREAFEKIISYHTDSIYIEVAKEKIAG